MQTIKRKRYRTRRQKREMVFLLIAGLCLLFFLIGRTRVGQLMYWDGKAWMLTGLTGKEIPDGCISLESAFIESVVDGDTVDVRLNDEVIRVRLIGIDTPESRHPDEGQNTPEGKAAEAYLWELLSVGQEVFLEADVSDTDRYGRRLYYIWLERPIIGMTAEKFSERMLNAKLLYEGYARAETMAPDVKYEKRFELLQETAKAERKGFWE